MSVEHDRGSPARRRPGALLAAAVLLHGLAYLLLLPPWMGEDEHWHLEYAHHVARGHAPFGGPAISADESELPFSQLQMRRRFAALPDAQIVATQRAFLAAMHAAGFWRRVDWAPRAPATPLPESFDQVERFFSAAPQPPLYYLLAGAWIRLASDGSPSGELWSARVLSLLLYAATVALALVFARAVLDDERVALAAALLVAWLPVHARQAVAVEHAVEADLAAPREPGLLLGGPGGRVGRVGQHVDVEAVELAGARQRGVDRAQPGKDALDRLVADRHHDGGAHRRVERRVAGVGERGDRPAIAARGQHQEAERGGPEADRDPREQEPEEEHDAELEQEVGRPEQPFVLGRGRGEGQPGGGPTRSFAEGGEFARHATKANGRDPDGPTGYAAASRR